MEEDNTLFQEITPEESAAVSGGYLQVSFDLNSYLFILGAGVVFGNPGLTPDEIQFAWESAFIFEDAPRRRTRRSRSF
ncbi:hypothetical protein [Nostoc sp. CCY 9925]|uniref:hypothetical protein n=1 Tax=Nostoc sp. CCY 9925 TaxID=3103865 RepID=UPI0039C6071A